MGVMDGKRGLVMGVANHNSIAHGCAKALVGAGAEIAITYQGPAFGKRVKPLAEALGTDFLVDCDVDDEGSIDAAFAAIEERWGGLDFVLHAIAFSDKDELKGRYADTSRANFQRTMLISCFSFTEVARRAARLMPPVGEDDEGNMTGGGAMATLTYGGSTRVMPNYNVMGVAKAALESSVRYLASDFGPDGIRVNSISPGAVRTLAGAGIADARAMMGYQRRNAPLRRTVTTDEVGQTAVYLLSDMGRAVTGEIVHVDAGFHAVQMPTLDELAARAAAGGAEKTDTKVDVEAATGKA